MQKIPGIGDIPILGLLFKSKAAQKNQTELVVMITPQILPNNSPGVTPNLPRHAETVSCRRAAEQDVPSCRRRAFTRPTSRRCRRAGRRCRRRRARTAGDTNAASAAARCAR